MVFQKRTINNVPTLVPLTADTGSGAPLGTIHGFYKKGSYPGYLYLDGSTFDQTLYPALYAYLGTNVLPDYREFVLVGAEQNTTSTVINQIEHTHDVFTQGEEKDDQLQYHEHLLIAENPVGSSNDSVFYNSNGAEGINDASLKYSGGNSRTAPFKAGTFNRGRYGTTTRTKEKAVFWYIKATTGISESEATDVLNLMTNRMFPDYAHPITIPSGTTTWTTTEDCYVNYHVLSSTSYPDLLINGNTVSAHDYLSITPTIYSSTFVGYVKKGQIISTAFGDIDLARTDIVKFFPLTA